jgi:lipoprotein-releasing system ATP-binding protein
MIIAQNIKKSFGDLQVLKAIDLNIKKGEIVSIVGASGAGKTTLLQIIGSLNKLDSGSIIINGIDINKISDNKLSVFRNQNLGFIFQFHHLLPEFTALENVCMPAFIAKKSKKEAFAKGEELLEYLGLTERKNHKPSELSGGEQQRVAIARALINNPAVILADEPTGNLDSKNSEELFDLFLDLREKFNHTFVLVTHDENLANKCDRKLVIKDGKIVY